MIRYSFIFISLYLLTGCANVQSFEVEGIKYLLKNNSGNCQLVETKNNMTISLKIPYPCQVHSIDNKVRVYKENHNEYILLEHSIPHPELPGDCLTQLQSVLLNEKQIKASEFSDTVATYPPFKWDANNFTGLFLE